MSELPDSTNFYSSLYTTKSLRQVAELFAAEGWEVVEPDDWDHLEVRCPWAELVIESSSTVLAHGPVADVADNAGRLLAVLARAGIAFTAECYGPDGALLEKWV